MVYCTSNLCIKNKHTKQIIVQKKAHPSPTLPSPGTCSYGRYAHSRLEHLSMTICHNQSAPITNRLTVTWYPKPPELLCFLESVFALYDFLKQPYKIRTNFYQPKLSAPTMGIKKQDSARLPDF